MPVSEAATALRRWVFDGAAQEQSGAYCAWREQRSRRLAFPYPEITGYALTLAAGVGAQDAPTEQRLARAADWLGNRIASGNLSARDGWDGNAIYTFDLGIIAAGLINFGRSRNRAADVEKGMTVVALLLEEAARTGTLPTVALGPRAAHPGWATEGRAHLLKLVQALLLADGNVAEEAAAQLIAGVDDMQCRDGRFVTQRSASTTMLHPHLYALEGLWIWGTARGDADALERARRGLHWALAQQLPTGGLPRFVAESGDRGPEQSDATAQAVRLAALLGCEGPQLPRAVERLEQLTGEGDSRAVVYQPDAPERHENVWATIFAAQALALVGEPGGSLAWTELA